MAGEVEAALPAGWKEEEESPAVEPVDTPLPDGWSEEQTDMLTPEDYVRKAAGPWYVEKKTPEELSQMSFFQRAKYKYDLANEDRYLTKRGVAKGFISGLTFGQSQKIEALKVQPGERGEIIGEIAGSILPYHAIANLYGKTLGFFVQKSPIFQKSLSGLASLSGAWLTGATGEAIHEVGSEEGLTPEKIMDKGNEWLVLDAALRGAGKLFSFAKNMIFKTKDLNKPSHAVVNDVINQMREQGVDFTNQEVASAKALEILESMQPSADTAAKKLALPEAAETATERVASERFAAEKPTVQDIKNRKFSQGRVDQLNREAPVIAEPYEPGEIDFTREAEQIENSAIERQLEEISPRAASEQEFGESIKESVEQNLEEAREAYRPLYEEAEAAAETITHNPSNTAREAGNRLRRLERGKTRPANYNQVIGQLENILHDAGYVVQRAEDGAIDLIVQDRVPSVSESIELGRRVNNLIDYEIIDPSVKNILKPVSAAVKQDIRAGLASHPDALAAFELAEAEHGRVAELYNRESIRKIRKGEAGEKIARSIDSPTAVEDLGGVLNESQKKFMEREILERLKNSTYSKGAKQLKEVERHLSEQNRRLAREIVESKNPHNPLAKKKVLQREVVSEVGDAFTEGSRPSKTLNLWKTKKGRKIVEQAFEGSSNWDTVKKYLDNQSFHDMTSSLVNKEGTLNLKKVREFINDPESMQMVREIGGAEAQEFFEKLQERVASLDKNARLLNKIPTKEDVKRGNELIKKAREKRVRPSKIAEERLAQGRRISKESSGEAGRQKLRKVVEKQFPLESKFKKWDQLVKENLDISARGALSVFAFMKLGLPNAVAFTLGRKMLFRIAKSPRVRRAFIQASKHQSDPVKFIVAIEELGAALDESEE